VIHATHPFAHVPSIRRHTNIILDEQPDYTADLAGDGTLFVETFAVWCSNCLRQQKTMIDFHEANPDATTVAVDIDPNEDEPKVQDHAEKHGFDWRYADSD